MKKITLIIFTLFHLVGIAQNFTGDYRSYKTSFQDFSTTKNNFVEETEFKIAVFIDKNQEEGTVIIQDPRIPKKLLAYKIIEYVGKINNKGITNYLYKCKTEHLDNVEGVTITFYINKQQHLNLMIYDKESSQVFFELKNVKE